MKDHDGEHGTTMESCVPGRTTMENGGPRGREWDGDGEGGTVIETGGTRRDHNGVRGATMEKGGIRRDHDGEKGTMVERRGW